MKETTKSWKCCVNNNQHNFKNMKNYFWVLCKGLLIAKPDKRFYQFYLGTTDHYLRSSEVSWYFIHNLTFACPMHCKLLHKKIVLLELVLFNISIEVLQWLPVKLSLWYWSCSCYVSVVLDHVLGNFIITLQMSLLYNESWILLETLKSKDKLETYYRGSFILQPIFNVFFYFGGYFNQYDTLVQSIFLHFIILFSYTQPTFAFYLQRDFYIVPAHIVPCFLFLLQKERSLFLQSFFVFW